MLHNTAYMKQPGPQRRDFWLVLTVAVGFDIFGGDWKSMAEGKEFESVRFLPQNEKYYRGVILASGFRILHRMLQLIFPFVTAFWMRNILPLYYQHDMKQIFSTSPSFVGIASALWLFVFVWFCIFLLLQSYLCSVFARLFVFFIRKWLFIILSWCLRLPLMFLMFTLGTFFN